MLAQPNTKSSIVTEIMPTIELVFIALPITQTKGCAEDAEGDIEGSR
jgi:hypothetical protein